MNNKTHQFLFEYMLRLSDSRSSLGAIGVLYRPLPRLRAVLLRVRIRFRLAIGFSFAELSVLLESSGLTYVVELGEHKGLPRRGVCLMGIAPSPSRESSEIAHIYDSTLYGAGR